MDRCWPKEVPSLRGAERRTRWLGSSFYVSSFGRLLGTVAPEDRFGNAARNFISTEYLDVCVTSVGAQLSVPVLPNVFTS